MTTDDAARRARAETTLGKAIDDCLFTAIVEGRSRETVRNYGDALHSLLAYACERGVTTPEGLTPRLLQAWATVMLDSHNQHRNHKGGEASVRVMFVAARFLGRWAATQGIVMPDLSGLKMPRLPQRVQPRVTAHEFRAMEAAVLHRREYGDPRYSRFTSARDLALLSFMGDTGLRIHEITALDVGDIDLNQGVVTVRHGKGGKGRALCLIDADPGAIGGGPTIAALRAYLAERAHRPNADKERAFWVSHKGVRFGREGLFRVLRRLCADAGLNGSRPPHAFRRAHFSENYNADPSSLPIMVARMGWASMETRMISTYIRGASIDLASSRPRPSVSRQWRGDPAAAQPPAPATAPQTGLSGDLVTAIQQNPELVRALLQALHGAD